MAKRNQETNKLFVSGIITLVIIILSFLILKNPITGAATADACSDTDGGKI